MKRSSRGESSNESADKDTENKEENKKYYRPGGFHPVKIGDTYKKRYTVKRKLGYGTFCTVWLAWDSKDKKFVALKIMQSNNLFYEIASKEIKLLKQIQQSDSDDIKKDRIMKLLDNFIISGTNGRHVCMVFEALGEDLLQVIKRSNYKGLPMENVKTIIRQILEGLDYLHVKCNVIHTDIKPENILVSLSENYIKKLTENLQLSIESTGPKRKLPKHFQMKVTKKQKSSKQQLNEQSTSNAFNKDTLADSVQIAESIPKSLTHNIAGPSNNVIEIYESLPIQLTDTPDPSNEICEINIKIADLGNACWADNKLSDLIQSRSYRSIEVVLGADYNTSADIWSTGCLAFELATGGFLFDPSAKDNYSEDEDHLAKFIQIIGEIPKHIALSGLSSVVYFDSDGNLRNNPNLPPYSVLKYLTMTLKWDHVAAKNFVDFLFYLLEYDPVQRPSAAQCLQHPWLQS